MCPDGSVSQDRFDPENGYPGGQVQSPLSSMCGDGALTAGGTLPIV